MKLSATSTFLATVAFSLPGDGPNVWRNAQFDAKFKAITPAELEDMIASRSDVELLKEVLVEVVTPIETDDVDPDTNKPYTATQIVQRNVFAAKAAVAQFISCINRDIEAKNSKRSRAR